MFDNEKFSMNINMTGKEYIEYRKYKDSKHIFKKPLSKKTKQALPYFILCGIGILLIVFLIDSLTYTPPPKGFISEWKDIAPKVIEKSWSDIGKLVFVFFAPFLVIMIGLAWLIHGFGFFIFKG